MDRLTNAKVEPGKLAIHWLGQGGFALKDHSGDVILCDPYLSDSANNDGSAPRMVDVPIRPKDVHADYLFLTHDHPDHTDPLAVPIIAQKNPNCEIICPPSSAHHLVKIGVPVAQIQTVLPGQTLSFRKFAVHAVTAHHTDDSVGYVFEFNEGNGETDSIALYLTGDTEYSDSLSAAVEDYGIDVLLVPINGRWGNMDSIAAAKLTSQIEPREVIPMHYGMFAANTADPDDFLAQLALEAGSDKNISAIVMKHNSCHIYAPDRSSQGREGHKRARAERARLTRTGGEHHDGVRGPSIARR